MEARPLRLKAFINDAMRIAEIKSLSFKEDGTIKSARCYYLEAPKETFQLSATKFQLMEGTGIEDKNGKEMYTGHVIKCFDPEDGEAHYQHVTHLVCRQEVYVSSGYFGQDYNDKPWQIDGNDEIISTIWQDPELLIPDGLDIPEDED